jgi:hypothetical protein
MKGKKRSPEREMSAWKTRVAALLRKEARCPSCSKAKRLAAGAAFAPVCDTHYKIRVDLTS